MNSPFANIYLALIERLLTITANGQPVDDDNPAFIRYIDMDYGQLESRERPSVAFPCAIIDFKEWDFENAGAGLQLARGIICIKIATDPYSSTSSITPDTWKEAALNILDLEYLVFRKLHGWKSPIEYDAPGTTITAEATPMVREKISTDDRRPGLKVRHLYFSTSFTDKSGQRVITYTPAAPVITTQIDTTP